MRDVAGARPLARDAAQSPQEQDYSVGGMFGERHREVLAKARGFDPNFEISGFWQPNMEVKDQPGQFDGHEFRSDLWSEMAVDPDGWMRGGFHAHLRDFQIDEPMAGMHGNEQLWELGAVLGGGRFRDDDTFVELQFEPGVYSDLDGTLTSKDWEFYGHARITWRHDDHLFFVGGVRADRTFADLDAYPQAGVVVQMHEAWRFDMLLPNYMKVQWNPTAALLLDLGLELDGNQYTIRESAGMGSGVFTWRTQDLRLFLGAAYRMTDAISLFGRVGGTIAGEYEFNGSSGQTEGTPIGSAFGEVGLGFDW
jgi:hypothetical protein